MQVIKKGAIVPVGWLDGGSLGNLMKVVICDESVGRRAKTVQLLGAVPGVEVVGVTEFGESMPQDIACHEPSLVVMDVIRNGKPQPDLVQKVREALPGAKIVVFSAHAYPAVKASCTLAGVTCMLHESHGMSRLREVVCHCFQTDECSVRDPI